LYRNRKEGAIGDPILIIILDLKHSAIHGTSKMQIERFDIEDILMIVPVKHCDKRGFFSETYRSDVLTAEGMQVEFIQDNHVYSAEPGVLRGLHFQIPPRAQGKLVRCTQGAILDVCVDIRNGSPTYRRHVAVELSAANWRQLWVPPGFAHGYLTLESHCEVIYKVTEYWTPDCERGIAWNDPSLAIDWGISASNVTLSDKDRANPRLSELEPVFHYDRGIHRP
jgi:dTDP-4-dehydrorhamnose 3,5-epimerase